MSTNEPRTLGEMSPEFFEAVCGPLDPSKVKAGDTVTVERDSKGLAKVDGTVEEVHRDGSTGGTGLLIRNITQYVFWLDEWTLTDHQPAPEPEPEWLAGDVSVIETEQREGDPRRAVRRGGVWHFLDADGYAIDEYVTDARPLVVIDPAAVDVNALYKVFHKAELAATSDYAKTGLRAALAELGIEAS